MVNVLGRCKPILLAHGGAGDWRKAGPERVRKAKKVLGIAVNTGYHKLLDEGALEAVAETVRVMEDSGVFNAGRGSVVNSEGIREMDAGIMDGRRMDSGGVALLRGFPNPILIALKVMRESPHVLLGGEGAVYFAIENGFEQDPSLLKKERKNIQGFWDRSRWLGDTVGAVAVDTDCGTAAAASTGGVRGKLSGRIGDSPVPGAGFYANNLGAVAATGVGEVILLTSASKTLIDMYERKGSLEIAGKVTIAFVNRNYRKGTVGLIAVTVKGEWGRFYNTPYLPVALISEKMGKPRIFGFPRFSQE